MPRLPFRIALFFSSYAPLFALLAYRNRRSTLAWGILAAITILSVLALIVVMNSKRGERGPRLQVRHSRPKDGDVLAYTATYLVPFLGLNLAKLDDVVTLCGFLLVLGIVYVNSDMLFVNPLLSLARYHSFWVTDQDGHEYSLITRRTHLDPDQIIHPAQVGRYVRLEVGDDRTRST
jgi:hypothetical protein